MTATGKRGFGQQATHGIGGHRARHSRVRQGWRFPDCLSPRLCPGPRELPVWVAAQARPEARCVIAMSRGKACPGCLLLQILYPLRLGTAGTRPSAGRWGGNGGEGGGGLGGIVAI